MKNNNLNYEREYKRQMAVFFLILMFAIACLVKIVVLVISKKSIYSGNEKHCWDQTLPNYKESPWSTNPNYKGVITERKMTPIRGDIFDDMGRPLRINYLVFDFTIDGTQLRKKDSLFLNDKSVIHLKKEPERMEALIDEMAQQLATHFYSRFKKDKEYYRKKLELALVEKKNVLVLASNLNRKNQMITSTDTAFIWDLPIIGSKLRGPNKMQCVNLSVQRGRINPYKELAERTIGSDIASRKYGIELYFDSLLDGHNGVTHTLTVFDSISRKNRDGSLVRNAQGEVEKERKGYSIWTKVIEPPVSGYDVHTTLNLEMQNIVHRMLLSKLQEVDAEWGTVVLMETHTGEIKAMSNLKKTGGQGYTEVFNHAMRSNEAEPGSTFKLASLITYLENNEKDTATIYNLAGYDDKLIKVFKSERVRPWDYPQHNYDGHAMDIFQASSNAGTVQLVYKDHKSIGEYYRHLQQLQLTQPIETQLEDIPELSFGVDSSRSRFYGVCYGAGFKIAPMRTLVLFNAVANNGKMLAPLFVKSISYQNKITEEYEAEVLSEQFCKPSTIEKAQKYLESVVTGSKGTARKFKNHYPKFAGKTGTRDIFVDGRYDYSRNAVSFCGYFPAANPKYTCIVYIYDIDRYKGTSIHALEVFANIATQVELVNYEDLREFGQQ